MKTAIYLRKSRQDEELEKKEKFDTLARHRRELLEVAKKMDLEIVDIKQELLSGDSIASRPKMQELLEEIKQGMYDAVLVMHIDRLGRGKLQDQGDILDTFKHSRTKIITPNKIYDLQNEFDEEYTEFETFMARKELKLIKKRLLRGRIRSVKDGKYMGTVPPYGYKFQYDKDTGERQLIIDEEVAPLIQEIFRLYINENMGVHKIATYLNEKGIRTKTGKLWKDGGITNIIDNKTYAGYNRWNQIEKTSYGVKKRPEEEVIEVKGKHEPIISKDIWYQAQEIKSKRHKVTFKPGNEIKNQFAGIVKCGFCGNTIALSTSKQRNGLEICYLRCRTCKDNGGIEINAFEREFLKGLHDIFMKYEKNILNENNNFDNNDKSESLNKTLELLQQEKTKLSYQRNNLHDLLEQDVYDIDTYLERMSIVNNKIEENKNAINEIKLKIKNENSDKKNFVELIPNIGNVLKSLEMTDDAYLKNMLYKSIIDFVIFKREKPTKKFQEAGKIDIKIQFKA